MEDLKGQKEYHQHLFMEMGDSAQVLEAEQCFTRATILAGHTRPLEAVLLLAQFVPARTELLLGVAR